MEKFKLLGSEIIHFLDTLDEKIFLKSEKISWFMVSTICGYSK